MQAESFERLKRRLTQDLDVAQCMDLVGLLQQMANGRLGEVAIQRRTEIVVERGTCVHCGHEDVVRHGRDGNGRQRFRCRAEGCGRTFNGLTGTALARMRKPGEWVGLAAQLGDHKSINQLADSGLNVSRLTLFRWRQKLLRVQAGKPVARLRGVVEADETYFRSSYKGSRGWKRHAPPENRPPRYGGGVAMLPGLSGEQIPVVTAVDHGGGVLDRVLATRADIADALVGHIEPGSVLCSDGVPAYRAVAELCRSEHRRIAPPKKPDYIAKARGGKPRKHGRLGLGLVNGHHQRIKTFVNRRANGVSTAHLHEYLRWLSAIRSPGFDPTNLLLDTLIHS